MDDGPEMVETKGTANTPLPLGTTANGCIEALNLALRALAHREAALQAVYDRAVELIHRPTRCPRSARRAA